MKILIRTFIYLFIYFLLASTSGEKNELIYPKVCLSMHMDDQTTWTVHHPPKRLPGMVQELAQDHPCSAGCMDMTKIHQRTKGQRTDQALFDLQIL